MTLEDQIQALLAKAEPLRCLPDDESESAGLPAIIDAINALRARQAAGEDAAPVVPVPEPAAAVEGDDAQADADPSEPAKRKPGRPRKTAE